jgi:hypothetical protein
MHTAMTVASRPVSFRAKPSTRTAATALADRGDGAGDAVTDGRSLSVRMWNVAMMRSASARSIVEPSDVAYLMT